VKIVALLAAYNEADVIEQVVADLIAEGLSVYLIDHSSTDGTAAAVARFVDRGLLGIERFPDESGFPPEVAESFAWESLLERKEQLAQLLDADWFLHTDADELRESPFPGRTLAEAIGDVDLLGYNAIDFAVFNFVPTDDRFVPGADLRSSFRYYQPAQIFDKLQIKGWKKQPSIDLRSSGGHEVQFAERRIFPIRFLDRHYPLRSQAQAERKVFHERKPRFVEGERRRGWHVQYDVFQPGHQFIQDPSALEPFDESAARRGLFEQHRGAEAADAQAAAVSQLLAERLRDLAVREQQLEEREREIALARRDFQAARRELDETLRAVAPLRAEVDRLRDALQSAQAKLEAAEGALRGVETRVDEIYASRTWRWTAPGRLLWHLLRR
jgi:hypothetical protein